MDTMKAAIPWAKQWPSGTTILIAVGAAVAGGFAISSTKSNAGEIEVLKREVASLQRSMDDVQKDVAKGRKEGLESAMFQARVNQCAASDNDELRQIYVKRVADLQSTYSSAGWGQYSLPICEDL